MTDVVELDAERPPQPIEYRFAETRDVRFADRVIEIIAVPYDEEAAVEYRGKMVVETIAPGAFDGVERRANRVKVNRDHERERPVGRAVALHPGRAEGLVAELRIAQTPLGDETLELAADGVLDASVGFAPFPGHQQWSDNQRRRRITKAWLGHIAMVSEPAYDGARVLAVRSAELEVPAVVVPTPNLDQVLLWQMLDRHPSAHTVTSEQRPLEGP
jgi:HK97 family phage prohead protease